MGEAIEQALLDYVHALTEAELAAVPDGLLETRWEALVHIFTHGTDHRAQILSMLHGLGAPTFNQDFGDHRRRQRRVSKSAVLRLMLFRRGEWDRLVAGVPAARLEEATPAGWRLKDTLAHLTWYDRSLLETVQTRRLAPAEAWALPPDERNRRIEEQHRDQPLAAVLEAHFSTHRALLEAIEALDDADLIEPDRIAGLPAGSTLWMALERNIWGHYLEHTETLWAWLGVVK